MKRVIKANSNRYIKCGNERLTDNQLWEIISDAFWQTGVASSHISSRNDDTWIFQDTAGEVYVRLSDSDVRSIVSYEQSASGGNKNKLRQGIFDEIMRYNTKKSRVASSTVIAAKDFSVDEFKKQLIEQKPKKATVPAEYESEIREMLDELSETTFNHLAWGYDKKGKNLKFKFNYNEDVESSTILAAKDKFDINKLEEELDSTFPKQITIPGKYFDQVCELLDSKDIDYAYGTYKRGKEYKFTLVYSYDDEDYED